MGDLISKSELLESLNNWIDENIDIKTILRWIKEFEIAYDVEKVATELEDKREEMLNDTEYDNSIVNHYLQYADEFIDIVRNGGKE